ncbi:MAG: site-specific integrase [Clostridiales Family XIII bacterium]|jgi:integrase|nr:site-specific integrase [Clostridiales Family XIII bacterium]
MAKRGENIYKRKDGRWEGRYVKDKKKNGKLIYGYIYGDRYGEVRESVLTFKHLGPGQQDEIDGFRGTFAEFAEIWLNAVATSAVNPLKPSTLAFYTGLMRTHLLPAFGPYALDSLTRDDVRVYADALFKTKISVNSARNVLGLFNRIMKAATDGMAFINPCNGVSFPQKDTVPVAALRLPEQRKLEKAAARDKFGLAVPIALYTGMRIGEICALRWDAVDFDAGMIQVTSTLQRIAVGEGGRKTKLVFGAPKSVYSRRSIPLAPSLKRRLEAQRAERPDDEYVITCKGSFAEPRALRYRFGRLVKKAGLGSIRFHDLRHTFATRCIETGIDITTLSRLLGHSSVKMTLDVYTDATPERKAAAMRRLDKLYPAEIMGPQAEGFDVL